MFLLAIHQKETKNDLTSHPHQRKIVTFPMTTICNRSHKKATAMMTSMLSGKKRKKPPKTSILTTIPDPDLCVRNTCFPPLDVPRSKSTASNIIRSSLPSSSSIRFLVDQKKKKQESLVLGAVDGPACEDDQEQVQRRLARRKVRGVTDTAVVYDDLPVVHRHLSAWKMTRKTL